MTARQQPTLSGLFVYPLKGGGGISLRTASVGRRGIAHDREFMVVDRDGRMITQRSHPRLSLIRPSLTETMMSMDLPDRGRIEFSLAGESDGPLLSTSVWEDRVEAFDQGDAAAEVLSSFLETTCRLARFGGVSLRTTPTGNCDVGFADAYSFLGIGDASLGDLNARMSRALPMNRFRPNLTFAGAAPFAEDSWRCIRIGPVALSGETLCARCAVAATDQESAARGTEPTATLALYRRGGQIGGGWKAPGESAVHFGRNFCHQGQGLLEVGMTVTIEETD